MTPTACSSQKKITLGQLRCPGRFIGMFQWPSRPVSHDDESSNNNKLVSWLGLRPLLLFHRFVFLERNNNSGGLGFPSFSSWITIRVTTATRPRVPVKPALTPAPAPAPPPHQQQQQQWSQDSFLFSPGFLLFGPWLHDRSIDSGRVQHLQHQKRRVTSTTVAVVTHRDLIPS
ncbi:hypothetical protein TSAR_012970 [Trichomalopsis sarcophagae]|uniref:Uncharacterized protein n=1 Tax=Trichomalopsis sarcophagae TaxID=543379 RepID=A0A232FHW4_9HYME|nr:hypothetical protein TSAR_012970 [Trichomalopsis sarcophagae]